MAKQERDNNRTNDESGERETRCAQPRSKSYQRRPYFQCFAAVVVVGDGKGNIGHGLESSRGIRSHCEGRERCRKEHDQSSCPQRYHSYEARGKFDAGRVLIKPAADGTGVIAGGAMRAVLEMAAGCFGEVTRLLQSAQRCESNHRCTCKSAQYH